ncbi:MAG: type IV toxin-antitoxin system AbiEi family antitoxin [Candidatus Rokuibacteriota bacterium]
MVLDTEVGELRYVGDIKRRLTSPRLEHTLLLLAAEHSQPGKRIPRMLFSDYIPPSLGQRLEEAGVDYVDAAGNVLIRKPGRLYLFRSGAKPPRLREQTPAKLSTRSSLQVLFVLLQEPTATRLSYRELATQSGVALGSVAGIMAELKRKGHLVRRRDGWELARRRALLDLWVSGYSERLRPALVLGRFQPPESDLTETLARVTDAAAARHLEYAVTGGVAADTLTQHYRGEQLTLFVSTWSRDLLQALRWLPSARGPVMLLRYFSPAVASQRAGPRGIVLAQPLLVYAELLHDGSERAREVARQLYEQHLAPLIDDDAA